jgi:hypothetical protein
LEEEISSLLADIDILEETVEALCNDNNWGIHSW